MESRKHSETLRKHSDTNSDLSKLFRNKLNKTNKRFKFELLSIKKQMMNYEQACAAWDDFPDQLDELFNMDNISDDQSDEPKQCGQSDGIMCCWCAQEGTWDEKHNVCWSILSKHVIWHPIGSGNPTIRPHAKECHYFKETRRKKRPRRKATISEEAADTPRTEQGVKVEGGGPSLTKDL